MHMKLSPEEEERAILAKAAKEKARREKAERRRKRQENKERKGKKKKKKSPSENVCDICNNVTAEVQCHTCEEKLYCQHCFVDAHYGLEDSQSHHSSPIELMANGEGGDESVPSGLKLPAIVSARSGRYGNAPSDDEDKKKKKKKKKKGGAKSAVEGSQSESEGGGDSVSSKGKKNTKKKKNKKRSNTADSITEDSDF